MCLKDLLKRLRNEGLNVTEAQVRWAINSGNVTRPPLDGSLRFVFGEDHVVELRTWFERRRVPEGDLDLSATG
jgi:hypothetical protein